MKVTLENWNYLQQKVRETGIQKSEYNSKDELKAITTKDGERFEFSRETFDQFKNAGLLKIGRRIEIRSTITCPFCGTQKEEEMPLVACLVYYECTSCGKVIRPKTGDCCVFCSFGSIRCPSKQQTF